MVKNELRAFMSPVYKYSILFAAVCQLVSMVVIGWNPHFLYGIALGTCVSIVNHNILSFTVIKTLNGGFGPIISVTSYIVRMLIYGGAFYISYKTSLVSGVATLIGYLLIKVAIYYNYGFKPGFKSKSYKDKELNDLDQDTWSEKKKKRKWKWMKED